MGFFLLALGVFLRYFCWFWGFCVCLFGGRGIGLLLFFCICVCVVFATRILLCMYNWLHKYTNYIKSIHVINKLENTSTLCLY